MDLDLISGFVWNRISVWIWEVIDLVQQHFCEEHQIWFFRNERKDENGNLKVWYSHKKLDGTGFCVEKTNEVVTSTVRARGNSATEPAPSRYMLMCNAMNNAVALASAGKIEVDQIG